MKEIASSVIFKTVTIKNHTYKLFYFNKNHNNTTSFGYTPDGQIIELKRNGIYEGCYHLHAQISMCPNNNEISTCISEDSKRATFAQDLGAFSSLNRSSTII